MIVADTNLLVHLVLGGEHVAVADAVHARDPEWAAPLLWRSELRNVLWLQCRTGRLSLDGALTAERTAQRVVGSREYDVDSREVLTLALSSGCSAYDCEFVALACALNVPLLTWDRQLCRRFPDTAIMPASFAPRGDTTERR